MAGTLDRYAAWNANCVPIVPDPHSGPRRAKRAKKTLATSRGLRWDIKGGARGWFIGFVHAPGLAGFDCCVRQVFAGWRASLHDPQERDTHDTRLASGQEMAG